VRCKKLALISIVALIFLGMSVASASATTWETYREDISISSMTVDIDQTYWHNDTTTGLYENVSLPCQAGNLNRTMSYFNISSTANVSYDLSVNGQSFNTTSVLNNTYYNTSLASIISGGVDQASTYLNFTFEVNATGSTIEIAVYGNDASCTSSFINSTETVKESDGNTPSVATKSVDSFWSVNDSINVSHSIGYTLTDISATFNYPSHAISEPTSSYNYGSIASGSGSTKYVEYQKYGPYVYSVDEDVDGDEHTVTVQVKSNELLTDVVQYTLNPTDEEYNGHFDTLNYDTLDVELNNVEIDWSEGSINMDELTVRTSQMDNEFTFTWTEEQPVEPEKEEFILPAWMIISIAFVVIVLILSVAAYKRKA
jgi:hypothetical protein